VGIGEFVQRAAALRLREIGITDDLSHWASPYFETRYREIRELRERGGGGVEVRVAVEVEYVPGREDELRRTLQRFDFDYVVATVHFSDQWLIEQRSSVVREHLRGYYLGMQRGARAGVFDIVANFDLPDQMGMVISPEIRSLMSETLNVLRDSGVAIEVSTAGMRNEGGAIRPSVELLREIRQRHIPIVLSSGAQEPSELGFGFDEAMATLKDLGFHHVASFSGRRSRPISMPE
jgi:histidinol-phosphatase (PHP family)